MSEVVSEDVLEWARDLAVVRDLLSNKIRADLRPYFAPRADRARAVTCGIVVMMPGLRACEAAF